MPHSQDDPAPTVGRSRRGGGTASRRGLLALTGSALATRPLATGQAHSNPGTGEEASPVTAAPARPPAFPERLTEVRAQVEWANFKLRFIQPDGRVVDNGNGGIAHSEGQGLALLFAAHLDEPQVFARVLRWTQAALGRTDNRLLAWCQRPDGQAQGGDRNNATDGDLLVAWALAEAAQRWGEPAHRALAVAMARDILQLCVIDGGDGALLLPGSTGFRHADSVTVNPSYSVYPAFQALGRLLPSPIWSALEEGGVRMAGAARFGRWGLVPDWVSVPRGGGRLGIGQDRPARFSYDAVRVPLYLAWSGHGREPVVEAAVRFWLDPGFARMPAWADLRTDETSPYTADAGIQAVAQLSSIASLTGVLPAQINAPILAPTYYAAALRLMAVMAVRAMPGGAIPGRADAARMPATLHARLPAPLPSPVATRSNPALRPASLLR